MLFWIVAGTLAALVALLLAWPLLRPASAAPEAALDQAIYRDQLAEVERDLARGILAPEEAERTRTEIARRLLAADRAATSSAREASPRAGLAMAALAAVLVVMGSLMLYTAIGRPGTADFPRAERLARAARALESRPSQAEAEARFDAARPQAEPEISDEERELIERLREVVPTRPNDAQGWELLAQNEARLGNFAAAAQAQAHLADLKGADVTAEDLVTQIDLMVEATGGFFVSPEAEAVMERLAAMDPESTALRYYAGLLYATTGRADLAFPLWRAVIEDAPADDWRRARVEAQIGELAWLAGVDYAPPAATPAPAQDQVAAAGDMAPEARQQMIEGMVQGLRDRLASEGGPVEDWARLVTSLSVLGDTEAAREALAQGKAAHQGDIEALALLDAAAQDAGLAQ